MGHILSRRRFLFSLLAFSATGISGGAYMRFIEPESLEVTCKRVPIKGLKHPLRLVHLSDFHASPVVDYALIERAVDLALEQKPDFVALTGDFITWEIKERPRYAKIIKKLTATAPVFACLGNHDGGRWAGRTHGLADPSHVVSLLDESGVCFLFNSRTTERIGECLVDIVGLGDLWSGDCQPERIKDFHLYRRPVFVLTHNPDSKELLLPFRWDLALCGHTHGGQLVIPFVGLRPFLPVKDKNFAEGLHRWHHHWIHITRGVGNLHGMRFNCRPEVSLLDLAPDQATGENV